MPCPLTPQRATSESSPPHIQADPSADAAERDAIDDALARMDGPMPWVTVEDFGTTGLAGNIEANDPKEPGNHFWGFFRSIGISPKGEDAGGSWGLGKWVFPDARVPRRDPARRRRSHVTHGDSWGWRF